MTHAEQREAIRERARRALRNLYHNATPTYPRFDDDPRAQEFDAWFYDAAEFEIEYLAKGGAYGTDYNATLRHPANAGRYKSEAARDFYVRSNWNAMIRERAQYAPWEWITLYGKLHSWGRGGRTLAPNKLIRTGGGSSFSIREDFADELPIANVVELILIVESFNAHVEAWCKAVPEMWREECANRNAEDKRTRQEEKKARHPDLREVPRGHGRGAGRADRPL